MSRICSQAVQVFLFLTGVMAAAQTVRMTPLVLTKEQGGWRASFSNGTNARWSLQNGDLVTAINGTAAGEIGPLAVMYVFNSAFSRPVPVSVDRRSKRANILVWRGDGPAPVAKTVPPNQSVAVTQRAPDFTLPELDGTRINLNSQRGKWVLLSFWATWCVPCQEEAKVLNQLARDHPHDLKVLAVAVNDHRDQLDAFVAKIHPTYTILDGGSLQGETALAYGVGNPNGGGSVPVNVLVRPNGTIAYVEGGYQEPSPLGEDVTEIMSGR